MITLRAESPVSEAAALYARARVFTANAPTGKDGDLATNSLMATCTFIARAYGFEVALPPVHVFATRLLRTGLV